MGKWAISLWNEAAQLEQNRTACDGGLDDQTGVRPGQAGQPSLWWTSVAAVSRSFSCRLGCCGAPQQKLLLHPREVNPGNYKRFAQLLILRERDGTAGLWSSDGEEREF